MLRLLLILSVSFLVGCQNIPKENFNNFDKAHTPLKIKANDKLGIAISGGGIRSSAFAYGVLKAMYDQGLLENAAAISTVSGGGYTGYELFLNDLKANSNNFGDATFGNRVFNERLFKNYATANFMTYPQIISAIQPSVELTDIYEEQLIYRYGYSESNNNTNISDFLKMESERSFPKFIINATLLSPEPINYSEDVFEFTPSSSGNMSRGFHNYSSESPKTSKLIAISGAAFQPFLEQEITDPTTYSEDSLKLSDGGHSENLGAFSLIRRGYKQIVIIDGEHDPEYSFGAYVSLKERVSYWGAQLLIPDIEYVINNKDKLSLTKEDHLSFESPLMTGTVVYSNGEVSNIFYIKMANSQFVSNSYTSEMVKKGKQVNDNVRNHLSEHATPDGKWDSKTLSNVNIDFDSLFSYHVETYPSILNSLFHVKLVNIFKFNGTKLHFPQYSTYDQSFYNNQFLAFIGLGYFSGKSLAANAKLAVK